MDRPIVYDQADVRDYDHLWAWRGGMYALAQACADLLGTTSTLVTGLAATPTGPTSLTINLAAGNIYQLGNVDTNAFGSLSADTRQILQQGFALAQQVTLTTTGLASGQSRWALIQATFNQTDVIPGDDPNGGLLPYLNTSNPSGPPWSGPNNSGATQSTRRTGVCTISVVYGNVATTGSEVPPNPSAGNVPLYLVDLAFGQTTIAANQILVAAPLAGTNVPNNYPRAPFLTGLTQQGQYAPDVGAVNAYVVELVPALTAHVPGMPIRVKIANSNTGASTFNPGPGAVNIVHRDGSAFVGNELIAGQIATLVYDGTNYQLVERHIAAYANSQSYAAHGTYTFTAQITGWHLVEVWGGGGGGGGGNGNASGTGFRGAGGAGGGYSFAMVWLTKGQTVTVTVGQAGAAGTNGSPSTAGGNGGTSSFGAFCSATGGAGGQAISVGSVNGGTGGVGSGGALNLQGEDGGCTPWAGAANVAGQVGRGGSAPRGGGGAKGNVAQNGYAPGGGGSGGTTNTEGSPAAPGTGADGEVLIRW